MQLLKGHAKLLKFKIHGSLPGLVSVIDWIIAEGKRREISSKTFFFFAENIKGSLDKGLKFSTTYLKHARCMLKTNLLIKT